MGRRRPRTKRKSSIRYRQQNQMQEFPQLVDCECRGMDKLITSLQHSVQEGGRWNVLWTVKQIAQARDGL